MFQYSFIKKYIYYSSFFFFLFISPYYLDFLFFFIFFISVEIFSYKINDNIVNNNFSKLNASEMEKYLISKEKKELLGELYLESQKYLMIIFFAIFIKVVCTKILSIFEEFFS